MPELENSLGQVHLMLGRSAKETFRALALLWLRAEKSLTVSETGSPPRLPKESRRSRRQTCPILQTKKLSCNQLKLSSQGHTARIYTRGGSAVPPPVWLGRAFQCRSPAFRRLLSLTHRLPGPLGPTGTPCHRSWAGHAFAGFSQRGLDFCPARNVLPGCQF